MIFGPATSESGATLITLGGDHGIPIPVMRALEVHGKPITLIHVDARAYGCDIITAYDMHEMGMSAVLDRIPCSLRTQIRIITPSRARYLLKIGDSWLTTSQYGITWTENNFDVIFQ